MDPYYYRSATQKSIHEDRSEIMAAFREITKRGPGVQLKLVNYYKGLPISYPATLAEVNGEVLELDVHPQQAVALQKSGRTCIKCSHFEHALLAEVKDADVRRQMASLYDLSFVDIMAEQRGALRLELEPSCEVVVTCEGRSLSGKVLDISLGGCSVLLEEAAPIGQGSNATLKIQVPNALQNTSTPVEVESTLVGTGGSDGEICRFSNTLDAYAEGVISRFIFQRQVDLIRELKELS